MKTKLGALLRAIRNSRHLTIKEVAAKAGISSSLLSQIERNRISPSLDTLLQVLEVYGVPPNKFFKDYDLKTMRFVFGDETLGKLNQLRRMVDLTGTAQIMAGNPSGTGQIVLAGQSIQDLLRYGQVGAGSVSGATGNVVGMAAPFLGPWAIAKTILSKPVKKYMTSGVTIPKMIERGLQGTGLMGGSIGSRGLMGYNQIKGIK